ncbi:pullulanase-associated domain-containing protein [Chitinimonas taiwanensis]|uniref:Pullanase-associated domain-containing protein n=1 Tax=Chitinimonas taiwanensis DSM 18899 TaxID=1121279 RepID=A0A1K2HM71_9NEIS|nr:pullulanase-associated domain-containing protein [Chitinimonas taiwanensis]SFZ77908.1 pullanase-associated domain-containing protein [Chitinimonas taiwanensis DSM 18899]
MMNKRSLLKSVLLGALMVSGLAANAADCKEYTPPADEVVIHYNRPDGNYADWGIHLWRSPNVGLTNWFVPLMPKGCDAFGVYFTQPLAKFGSSGKVNYIIHKGDVKEQGAKDMSFDSAKGKEVWINSGDPKIYFSKDEAVAAKK